MKTFTVMQECNTTHTSLRYAHRFGPVVITMLRGGPSANFVKKHLLHELHLGIKSQNEKK